jgi:hypothetical protein
MSSVVGYPQFEQLAQAALVSEEPVRQQIWQILAGLYPRGNRVERRSDQRFPYPYLVYLTPVAADGLTPGGESVIVIGKHLSERGLGFYHQKPLSDRRMIASLELQKSRWAGFLIDLTWCRFTQHGWYDSGGRFLQAVASPVGREIVVGTAADVPSGAATQLAGPEVPSPGCASAVCT